VATTAALLLLPEKPRYPKLGAYPKYDAFTILFFPQNFGFNFVLCGASLD
jgi:hypothetical protein